MDTKSNETINGSFSLLKLRCNDTSQVISIKCPDVQPNISFKCPQLTTWRYSSSTNNSILPASVAALTFVLGVLTFIWNHEQKKRDRRQERVRQKDQFVKQIRGIYFNLNRRPISYVTTVASELQRKLDNSGRSAIYILLRDLEEYARLKRTSQVQDDNDHNLQPRRQVASTCGENNNNFEKKVLRNESSQTPTYYSRNYISDLYHDMNEVTEFLIQISAVIEEFRDLSVIRERDISDRSCIRLRSWGIFFLRNIRRVTDNRFEEFESIGMKLFVDSLWEFWLNYYFKIYGKSDGRKEHSVSLAGTEDSYFQFLCQRIHIVKKYFGINQGEGKGQIKFTEPNEFIELCDSTQFNEKQILSRQGCSSEKAKLLP